MLKFKEFLKERKDNITIIKSQDNWRELLKSHIERELQTEVGLGKEAAKKEAKIISSYPDKAYKDDQTLLDWYKADFEKRKPNVGGDDLYNDLDMYIAFGLSISLYMLSSTIKKSHK